MSFDEMLAIIGKIGGVVSVLADDRPASPEPSSFTEKISPGADLLY